MWGSNSRREAWQQCLSWQSRLACPRSTLFFHLPCSCPDSTQRQMASVFWSTLFQPWVQHRNSWTVDMERKVSLIPFLLQMSWNNFHHFDWRATNGCSEIMRLLCVSISEWTVSMTWYYGICTCMCMCTHTHTQRHMDTLNKIKKLNMFTFKQVRLYEQTVLSVGERDSLRAQKPPVADHTALAHWQYLTSIHSDSLWAGPCSAVIWTFSSQTF